MRRLRSTAGRRRSGGSPLVASAILPVALLLTGTAGSAALGQTAAPHAVDPAVAGVSGATGTAAAGTPDLLLALGDSLASGYQPTDGTSPPPDDPADGRPDRGYPGSYPADVAAHYGLRLVDLACPGETTESMSGTPAEPACASFYKSWLGAANQESAALRFLDAHRGQVALLTFDLGANDLDRCASSGGVKTSCILAGEADVASQLPSLLATLTARLARDDPGAHAVAMNYYDPFLGLAFSPGGTTASAEASASEIGLALLNTTLQAIDASHHLLTADVSAAFHTGSVLPLVRYGGKTLPRDVAVVCELTWMCPLAGSPVRHADVHPRTAGYATIASAFESALAAHHLRP